MRKILTLALLAATAAPMTANAQTGELHRDRQDLRQEQRELRQAQRHGDWRDVRDERQDVRQARREYRQDWREYRRENRNVYARGNWNAPFRYQHFAVGAQLRPNDHGSRYYVSNYARYRLPAPAWNTRYVRHYDDVLLVNVRTGRVINVYHNFFW